MNRTSWVAQFLMLRAVYVLCNKMISDETEYGCTQRVNSKSHTTAGQFYLIIYLF